LRKTLCKGDLMTILQKFGLGIAIAGLLGAGGCRIQVDKAGNGQDKNVKIDTPLGGIHVSQDATAAADIGLPVYPGAQPASDGQNDKSADVHMGFGEWQLRVKVVKYRTSDSEDKVITFYRKALGRYGDVIECRGNESVGTPSVTREGLTCSDDGHHGHIQVDSGDHGSGHALKAGSKRHQHILGIERNDGVNTKFTLVELDLPVDSGKSDQESN
jgi:hypothetical protein